MNTKTHKKCPRCKDVLPRSEFGIRTDGYSRSKCDLCEVEAARDRRAANPQAAVDAVKRYGKKNPDKVRAWARNSYARNPEARKAKVREYQKAHPEETRRTKTINGNKRRLKKDAGHVPVWVVRELFALFNNLCAYCKAAPAQHVDHIMPLSKGGEHIPTNIAPACAHCNLTKSARLPLEFEALTGHDVQGVINMVSNKFGSKPN